MLLIYRIWSLGRTIRWGREMNIAHNANAGTADIVFVCVCVCTIVYAISKYTYTSSGDQTEPLSLARSSTEHTHMLRL